MLASDLLLKPEANLPTSPESPLLEPSLLQECQLLDVRFDALRSTVGLLFELRAAMYLSVGAAAVVVARSVDKVSWCADRAMEGRTAWAVIGAECGLSDGPVELGMYFSPNASLLIRARFFEFYNLDVIGLGEKVPDYVDDEDVVVRQNIPQWDCPVMPLTASFRSSDGGCVEVAG